MLVHMTPGEVHGLQSLAQQHGGSLTINPHTGLPEAGFLSSILPAIAGAGLMMIPGMQPWGAALLVGGGTALMTGDLKKGLMSGLGAYGGAGLGEGLAQSGVAAGANETSNVALQNPDFFTNAGGPIAPPPVASAATPVPADMSFADRMAAMGKGTSNLTSGQGWSDLSTAMGGKVKLATTLGGMALPVAADAGFFSPKAATPPAYTPIATPKFTQPYDRKVAYDPNKSPTDSSEQAYFQPTYPYSYAATGGSVQDIQANAQPVMPPNQMLGGSAPNENQFYPGANIAQGGASGAPQAPSATDVIGGYDQKLDQYTGEPVRMAGGGLTSLHTYAAGGTLLQGPGDGMSDSIPAVIGGAKPQRAALAQGEFVVPADVVSHLGNGSTDAGSKRLYTMMDKVRHARTGSKKQGRQINPAHFMPA